ncbi:MAG: transposase [Candidatus Dadabacteria bacterium]|nr:transposase [Candidatus Dadabacteria bacterium]
MATPANLPFSWEQVDSLSDLRRLELVLDALPDTDIMRALSAMRRNGRNEYPVAAMWKALIAGIVFQHESIESLIRELNRNSSLLAVCGFCPVPLQSRTRYETGGAGVIAIDSPPRSPAPGSFNFSRFLSNVVKLEERRGLVSGMIEEMRGELMRLLPDFGENLGYDGKALRSNSTGNRNRKTGKTSDPEADWGKHEYSGVDSSGKTWTKIKTWFGYGLHIIADTRYELPVAFSVTRASVSEVKELDRMTELLFAKDSELKNRCRYLSADRGLDSGPLKKKLWEDWGIRPIIDSRELWREEKRGQSYVEGQKIMRPLGRAHDNIFYTECAEVWCRCPVSGEERKMAFCGFESPRETLKFRCPAAVYGLRCKGWEKCHGDAGCKTNGYGRVVRVPLEFDRRIFTPTPRGSVSWRRAYNRRSALERINSRIEGSFRFERHFIRGVAKMSALAVMMALAVGHIKAGRPECMRSLVSGCWADTG